MTGSPLIVTTTCYTTAITNNNLNSKGKNSNFDEKNIV